MLVAGVICGVIGIGLLINALVAWWRQRSFVARATRAEGTVVELVEYVEDTDDGTKTVYSPKVRFRTVEGREVEFVERARLGAIVSPYHEGDVVRVHYDAQKPEDAMLTGQRGRRTAIIAFVGLGLLVFAVVASVLELA